MSLHYSYLLPLLCAALIVLFRIVAFRRIWNRPLAHGAGFFFIIEVAPGFYEGPGRSWLRRYRGCIVAEHSLAALALLALICMRRWGWLPLWAGACALLFVLTSLGFAAWTHHSLKRPTPVPSRIAVALETRRVSQYISWPAEAMAGAIVVASWLLLLAHGDAQVRWRVPVVLTYTMLGLISAKFGVVRAGFRLPAERIAEHHRWVDANRRHALRVLGSIGWFIVALLTGYALLHSWPPAQVLAWLRWLFVALVLGVWLLQVVSQFRGEKRLADMGRDLRPLSSWPGALPHPAFLRDSSLWWTAAYVAGFALLLVFFQR